MIRNYRVLSEIRLRTAVVRRRLRSLLGRLSQNARPKSQLGLRSDAGFTLIEIVFVIQVIMLLFLIGFNESRRLQEHARVSACLSFQVAIQRTLWGDCALTGDFPDNLAPLLVNMPPSAITPDFSYVGGTSAGTPLEYYIRCNHDHSYVSVLFVDSGSFLPPKAIYNVATARGNIP